MPRLDNTLASNAASAYLPRVDSMAVHGVKYLIQQWAASLSDIGKALGGRAPSPNLTPLVAPAPRNVGRMSEPAAGQVKPARLETLKCAETGREHPVLPREQCDTMISYRDGIGPSENPAVNRDLPNDQTDAFRHRVSTTDGEIDLLPPTLMQSSLLNRGLQHSFAERLARVEGKLAALKNDLANTPTNDAEGRANLKNLLTAWQEEKAELERLAPPGTERETLAPGKIQEGFVNTLLDPKTGLSANITVRNGTEVVINFGGLGSQGAGKSQLLRCITNIIGLAPPKNFAQASKLTQMVKARLQEVNDRLPPGQPKYTLKLAGHSMGGGMATYAALRNDTEAVVFTPLRLGLFARAKIGRTALKNAPALVKEVVVKGDWVSDTRASWGWGFLHLPSLALTGRRADAWGAIGQRYLVPSVPGLHPHVDISATLSEHARTG